MAQKKAKTSRLSKAEEKAIRKRIAQLTGKQKMTVQRTLPYLEMLKNGICMIDETHYSRTVQFGDLNYQLASDDRQDEIFNSYCDILNYFDESVRFQLTFENQNTDIAALRRQLEIPKAGDDTDTLRAEYTSVLFHQLEQGTNGRQFRKYLTFTVEADSLTAAKIKLDTISNELIRLFRALGVQASAMTGTQRLESLYRALNPFETQPFLFDWETLRRGGYSTKDFIAPTSLMLNKSTFEMGNVYGAVASINIIGGEISDRILWDFLREDEILSVNIHARPYDQVAALKFCRAKLSDVEKSKIDEQKRASRDGYDMSILPPQIQMYIDDLNQMLKDLNDKSERLFHITLTVRCYAESPKKLRILFDKLKRITQKNNGRLIQMDYMQEQAIGSSLPLGWNGIPIDRCFTTSAIAGFIPFTTEELFQAADATYYGLNSLSRNMIMADRLKLSNPNGLVLAVPGKGKSMAVKREICDVFFRTEHDIVINDPEGEYRLLVERLHGQVVKISADSGNYINPMDIPLDNINEELIANKSNFMISFCSLIIGDSLQADEVSLIDRCLRAVYMKYLKNNPDVETMPMLEHLQNELRLQSASSPDGVGKRVADSMDMYVSGSQRFFNHRTTVDISNRLVCFDIRDLNDQLRDLAMLIIQNEVWNRVSLNRDRNRKTWYYCDEFHLMLREKHTAQYCVEMWKRFRKWGGVPTGITQNVRDLITGAGAESILSNSEFLYLLSQSPEDRAILAAAKHLSEEQQKYITNAQTGHGLMLYGGTVIPFEDDFPKDTELFRLMDTRPKEK